MIARRLIVLLVLLALVGNVTVLANPTVGNTPNEEGQAFTLVSLKHETVGAQTRILIESSAPPLYTVFRPSDRLIVIDLPGGEASALSREYSVKNALVDLITVRQPQAAATSSRHVARIEVAVRSDVRDRSTVNGNTLVIELSPTPGQTQQKAANVASKASGKQSAPGVEVYPAPTVAKSSANNKAGAQPVADRAPVKPNGDRAAAASNPLRPATLVRAVRSEVAEGGARIWVHTDGAAQFKDFMLNDPWRVVVDITGVRSEFSNKTATVGGGAVDRVRVGQPSDKVVRVVLDTKSKLPYRVEREGESLVITVGNFGAPRGESAKSVAELKAQNASAPASESKAKQAPVETKSQSAANPAKEVAQPAAKTNVAQPSSSPEVKVASERVEKDAKSAASEPAKQASEPKQQASEPPSNMLAQASRPSSGQSSPPRVTPQPNRSMPLPTQPSSSTSNSVKETVTHTAQPTINRSAMDVQPTQPAVSHNTAPPSPNQNSKQRSGMAFCDAGFVGGLISFDLRAGVDMRDMLRFVSQQYGVNFIVDKSVQSVPVDIRVTDLPWNQVIESVMKANRLGAVCESNGRMIRIATLSAIKEEEVEKQQLAEVKAKQIPLVTKIIHLKYARAAGSLGDGGMGQSGRGSGGASGGQSQGSLLSIINSRKSERGRIEMESRTNSLIITDLPEYVQVMEDLIAKLDRPQPQVEIEARIVIASRNFLRDIGNEIGAAAINGGNGATGFLQTTPLQLQGRNLAPGGQSGGGSGGSGSGSGSGDSGGGEQQKGLGPNLVGPFADTAMRAGVANTVLSLTTGLIGTSIISAALSASETKGQIRTIASPRITATDNQSAEIVNGVQIPVQTVSNNTITTTFVTAALRLEITPQIIEETGEVLMHVVAENNTVNFGLANQFNNGTPGIDTQSAESTVRVADGGTTVMGGINIDVEGHTVNRTPGVSRIPIVGHMFKRKTTRRNSDEILFFLTPRIVRSDGVVGPRTQRSSVEGMPNPAGPQRAASPSTPSQSKPVQANAAVNGKGGQ